MVRYAVYIAYKNESVPTSIIWYGYTRENIENTVTKPFNEGRTFWVSGRKFQQSMVDRILIFECDKPSDQLILPNGKKALDEESDNDYVADCYCRKKINGVCDVTNEFIFPLTNEGTTAKSSTANLAIIKNKIFIVHGRDNEMKEAVARALEKLECEAIILHEQPNEGRTVIEKFTDYADVSFAVVLLSPDDMVYINGDPPEKARPRARQNVILELGFFMGKLERKHTVALCRKADNFEMPSDYAGVVYIDYDDKGHWKYDLAKELRACGYKVDSNKL